MTSEPAHSRRRPRFRLKTRRHQRGKFGGLYHVDVLVGLREHSRGDFILDYIPHVIIDFGTATTTISGFDARRMGINYGSLKQTGLALIGRHALKSYRLKNVLFVFRSEGKKPCYEYLPYCDVLAPEEGMNKKQHLPSMIGTDLLERFTIKPRKKWCYLERGRRS